MRTRFTLAVGAITLLAAACGGGGSDGGDQVASLGDSTAAADGESTTTTALDPEEAALAFEDCMAEHGVEVQVMAASEGQVGERSLAVDELEPGEDPPAPPDPEELAAAQEECNPLLEGVFGDLELTPEQEAEMRDAQLALQQCLEDRGIEGFEAAGNGGFGMRLDPEAEDFDDVQEAMRECGDEAGIVDVLPGGRQAEEAP